MKRQIKEAPGQVQSLEPDPKAVCDVCGRFGAFHFGDRTLCRECYAESGSCCPEFGKDDLWDLRDDL
ncbi:MAG TPA: hypothetical protein PKH32_08925 [Verrucomicrobiota bacterium]|nr:hypothetical protein [Verrucomicrobiota bacterium]